MMGTAVIGSSAKRRSRPDQNSADPRLGPERAPSRSSLPDHLDHNRCGGPPLGRLPVRSPDSAAVELAAFLPASFDYVVRPIPISAGCWTARPSTPLAWPRKRDPGQWRQPDPARGPADRDRHALRHLGERVVFVPALDGGYSIVGLNRRVPEIFAGIPWSTSDVMRRSLEQAERHAIPTKVLSPWYDIDDEESLTGSSRSFAARRRLALSSKALRRRPRVGFSNLKCEARDVPTAAVVLLLALALSGG